MKTASGLEALTASVGAIAGMFADAYVPSSTVSEIAEGVAGVAAIAVGFVYDGYVGDFIEGLGAGLLAGEILSFVKK